VYQVCEERSRLLGLYYETVEGYAGLVAQLREVAGGRNRALFDQLNKRSEALRLDAKRVKDKLFRHRKKHQC